MVVATGLRLSIDPLIVMVPLLDVSEVAPFRVIPFAAFRERLPREENVGATELVGLVDVMRMFAAESRVIAPLVACRYETPVTRFKVAPPAPAVRVIGPLSATSTDCMSKVCEEMVDPLAPFVVTLVRTCVFPVTPVCVIEPKKEPVGA